MGVLFFLKSTGIIFSLNIKNKDLEVVHLDFSEKTIITLKAEMQWPSNDSHLF